MLSLEYICNLYYTFYILVYLQFTLYILHILYDFFAFFCFFLFSLEEVQESSAVSEIEDSMLKQEPSKKKKSPNGSDIDSDVSTKYLCKSS